MHSKLRLTVPLTCDECSLVNLRISIRKRKFFELYQAIWKENFTQRGRLFFETRKASKITDKILILNGKEMREKYLKLIVRWRLNTLTSIIFIRGSIPKYAQSWDKGRQIKFIGVSLPL